MICYFDRLQKHTLYMPREFSILKEWRQDVVKKRIGEELGFGFGLGKVLDKIPRPDVVDIPIPQYLIGEYNQMLREATERIANDFVNLSNLLRLGERFHTTPLVEETTIYNVKAMWSKCAGAKLPSEIQQPTQNQRVEGASILSQDTDFFASDWFGNIIDDVVKNVVMNDGVQPEDVNGRQQEYEGIWKTPPTAQVDEPSFELRLQVDDVDKVFSDPMSDIEKTVFSDPKSDI
uniref:Uncharacterized protein n=1 Tax=Chenopodium quinoa TaxID=63459 RepID=A0A803KTZ6_CHEQI